jgi:hypothetical protein
VPQREEESARLACGCAAVEQDGERRRGREEPEEVGGLRAAAGQSLEERVEGVCVVWFVGDEELTFV